MSISRVYEQSLSSARRGLQGHPFNPFDLSWFAGHDHSKLQAFLPRTGLAFAWNRPREQPGHAAVSGLSPYVRHRLLLESEVTDPALAIHGAQDAEKFLSAVHWRTYWKGWLERRPCIWRNYSHGLLALLNRTATESGLRKQWQAVCEGRTGIDTFDLRAQEPASTGCLHNHVRLWFASIFTLRRRWELGAENRLS